MPFLLMDDATDEATRRLQEYGQGLLQPLQQAGQGVQQLGQGAQQGLSDITGRLQDYGQSLLQPLTQNAPTVLQAPQQGLQDITQRLQQHGQQVLDDATSQLQQLQPLQALQQFKPPEQPQPLQPAEPGGDLQAYARQAAQKAGIDPDVFVRQIQQESGFNPSARSGAGAVGIAQFMPGTAQGMGIDPTDPYAALDAAARLDAQHLQQYGGDWSKALAAYNAGAGNVDKYGGVPPFAETQRYVQDILGGARQAIGGAVQGATQAVQQAASNVLPAISQFGDKQLTAAEAYAACGPAAAVRFASMMGRQPTLQEALGLARQVGWTPDNGMAGLGSESALFDKLQIPHRMVGADWNALAKEASSGNPVTISTPGHYFTADNYDPSTGAFHVGSSGTDLRGGGEWMTPAQMEARMGQLQGGLAVDNPQVPLASTVQGAQQAVSSAFDRGGQAVQRGMTLLNDAVQQAGTAYGQQQQQAKETLGQAGIEYQPTDLTSPHFIAGSGVDPLAALQRGVPDITGGLQSGDIGRALGGVGEIGLGLTAALPGAGGAEAALGRGMERGVQAVREPLEGMLAGRQAAGAPQTIGEITSAVTQRLDNIEERLLQPDLAPQARAELQDAADTLRSARQQAAASPMFAARLAGGLAGAVAGNVTTPEDASPLERALRIGALVTAGAAAPSLIAEAPRLARNPAIDQTILENLRFGGLNPNTYQSQGRGLIGTAVDLSKQGMLSSPVTHITNAIGNTIELLRSPVGLVLGGRPSDAAAGMAAVAQAIPEAGINAWRALRGAQGPTLGAGASTTRGWEPVFRLLGGADMFTRTLGEYQGMAERASQLLRDANIAP